MSDTQQLSLQQQQVLSALMNQNSQFPGKMDVTENNPYKPISTTVPFKNTSPASMTGPYGFSANLNTSGVSGLNS